MAIESFKRYEQKYIVDEQQFQIIYPLLLEYMKEDSYTRKNGFYPINNIYFDTVDDDLIQTSINKPAYKEKLRMRSYGPKNDEDTVFLEIKKKIKPIVTKRRITLPLKEAYDYTLRGIHPGKKDYINPYVMNELDVFMKRYDLMPKVYLSYERKALAGREDSKLRVTFDQNILARRYDLDLRKGAYGDRVLPEGYWLMEIKISQAMPLWLTRLLSEYKIYPVSFSKYGTEYRKYVKNKKGAF